MFDRSRVSSRLGPPRVLLMIVVSLVSTSSGIAGKVELSGGGQLTGDVRRTEKPDGSTAHVVVRVDQDLSIAVAGAHVRRAVEADELKEYRERAAAAGQDAEAQFELARWCKSKTLLPQYRYHLTRTIEIEPDHSLARAALGFVRNKSETGWISYEVLRRSQGLIEDMKGRWVLPEVLAASQFADESDKKSKLWIKQFRRMNANAIRGDAEAMAEIEAIDDPYATDAIAAELIRSRKAKTNLRTLRLGYVRLLGRLRTFGAVKALVEAGLNEPDELIRQEALRQLTEYGASSAVATYVPLLQSQSPEQVKAAARALAYFPNPELAFAYTNALITEHKIKTQIGSGGTQAGFGNNGGAGLTQGAKIVEQTIPVRHPEVLQLVKMIAPKVDYGYNETEWRNYFAALRNPHRSDLRRDP
ncbi:HEAT repeat domain-containing protein [Aporhodopirellula aestuarii]|uniref:HEAT repeat domain-containing protein n=1 Tax=Aporhodopirellula aestuarii TaxID=2950107 RepID=A0ABT0UBU2_9BACT|nr:HEAT repeat domain-containing protein [Aporhodopirellula aestuarii]MCM2373838.1 HEAT repeat domain-containing protein [Aporhodopirellula aestuarii]